MSIRSLSFSLALVALIPSLPFASADRTLTIKNNCDETVWPAFYSAAHAPHHPTGWKARPGSSESLTLPTGWIGRVWGRTKCDFSKADPAEQCSTGGCNGGLECINTGIPPVTLSELTVDTDGTDWLDISLVDGFNLPMSLENTGGCFQSSCSANINARCPGRLQVHDDSGQVVGCKSDCLIASDPSNSPACCSGKYSTPQKCPSSGVPDYHVFKDACPDAYAYAYDDKTSLHTCPSSKQAAYTVTFCPN